MVAEVRRGRSMRSVARTFRVTLDTVERWVTRAADWGVTGDPGVWEAGMAIWDKQEPASVSCFGCRTGN